MARRDDIHEIARGKWRAMLPALGVAVSHLTGKHGPCPMCGGKDRYRFTDRDGSGDYICGQCGPGSGFDLVMGVKGVDFKTAARLVRERAVTARVNLPKAGRSEPDQASRSMFAAWEQARPLDGMDPASMHLARRGLGFDAPSSIIRFQSQSVYYHPDRSRTFHPAMLARFFSPDAKKWTLHTTFLTSDGSKANVKTVRKFWPGPVPVGGAIRLAASAETMGVATGIETALAAAKLFGVPVWATTVDGALAKFNPPARVKNLIIFGDLDPHFGGQSAAYQLAHRLSVKKIVCDVRIPPDMAAREVEKLDWNDVLREVL